MIGARPEPEEQWALVEQVFDEGHECATCPRKFTEREPHGEVSRYCDLLSGTALLTPIPGGIVPDDCPGFYAAQSQFQGQLRDALIEELEGFGEG